MGLRRQSRERALQLLFQWDVHRSLGSPEHGRAEGWEEDFWQQHPTDPDVREFAERLARGVMGERAALDEVIARYASNWRVDRMPIVDRNILRSAIYELLWMPEVPGKVTVNEAIELAKRFADDETRRFVNGVLDRVLRSEARLAGKREAAIQRDDQEEKTDGARRLEPGGSGG